MQEDEVPQDEVMEMEEEEEPAHAHTDKDKYQDDHFDKYDEGNREEQIHKGVQGIDKKASSMPSHNNQDMKINDSIPVENLE